MVLGLDFVGSDKQKGPRVVMGYKDLDFMGLLINPFGL